MVETILLFLLGIPIVIIGFFAILIGLCNFVILFCKITGYLFKYDRNDTKNMYNFPK
jgi:ABC-type phosphate transport system permease subunit